MPGEVDCVEECRPPNVYQLADLLKAHLGFRPVPFVLFDGRNGMMVRTISS